MDKKTITYCLVLAALIFLGCGWACAAETTITGKTSCIMPELLGFNTPQGTTLAPASEAQAPIISGAAGSYDVTKETKRLEETKSADNENLIQTEKTIANNNSGALAKTAAVYTICAR